MRLYWGVIPLQGAPTQDFIQVLNHVSHWGLKEGRLSAGDHIVLAAGTGLGTVGHNVAIVHEVK